MPDLTITLIQTALVWEDIDTNLAMLTQKIKAVNQPTDLIVLPEMFSTGFSLSAPQLAETMDGKAVSWLRSMALDYGAAIAGSLMITEDDRHYNRLVCAGPDGALTLYDKKHLFRYADEDKVFTPGTGHGDFLIKGWRIRPFICYDLRFPIWGRNLKTEYDLALYVANWPAARADHWKTLLKARAIENQTYVAGVNRVGTDGNNIAYSGDSMVVGPQGHILAAFEDEESLRTILLDFEALQDYRQNFPAWMDADQDLINPP
jgi:predicted amidohydrolase